jgi:ribonuclease P protein component
VRNRVRRLLREAVRARWPSIIFGWDIVLIARVAAAGADFWQLSAAVDSLLERASLLSTERTPDQQSTAK